MLVVRLDGDRLFSLFNDFFRNAGSPRIGSHNGSNFNSP